MGLREQSTRTNQTAENKLKIPASAEVHRSRPSYVSKSIENTSWPLAVGRNLILFVLND